jgi:hypothetical protein
VIQSAKYNNVSNTPDPTDRDITTKANDGAADSTVAHTTVTVTPTNDAPTAQDETFNATNSAIGNTTLNVNDTNNHGGTADGRPPTPDPTDTSPTTDRPHKEITGDIIANDTDPESPNSDLTVTPGTFATNDGGTVTIQSDGDFNFEPAPSTSCTDTSDFFDYTVTDNAGTNTGTDTGRVTVAITGCVWYVNNNDGQGNSGTSEKPFDTLAQAQTASSANQTIFVYDGDDTTTGYNTGISLKSGQTLQSEAATLTIGSDTLHTADAANKASLTNNNADVVSLNNGTTVKGLNLDPQGTGGGICGGTACGGNATASSTLDDVNIVDNGTKGTQPGLELNGSTGTFNISNLTVNNGDGSSATTGDEGVKLNNAGTVNFASTGTISITTNGAAGLDAAAGGGTTSLGSASTFDDITVTNSGNGGVLLAGTTGSGTAFGDGSGNDLQLTTVSGSPAAFSVQTAGSFSVPSAGQSDVSATGGPAVDVVSSSGSTMPFDSVSSTNSANDGVNIDSIGTGTFSATSGSVGGEAGIGFDLNGGSGAITYPGTFNNGSGPLVAEVTGRTGGVVSLAGNMNDNNDAGGGVDIANNTGGSTIFSGATKQFNTGASDAVTFSNSDGHTFVLSGGGTAINTTSGNGVNATTSGTFQVSGTGNTIDSTALAAGNRGLNIADTDIGFTAGVAFDHINTSGGTNGIRVNNNTNSAGGLTVTGIGGTCTAANTTGCSGGVIQNSSDAGIDLTNDSGEASLTRINVKNGADDGFRTNSVGTSAGNGIALANSVIANNGNAVNEHGLDWTNVLGISSINSTVATGNAEFNARFDNSTGTGRLTVDSSTFSSNSTTTGADGLLLNTSSTAAVRALVQNSTFQANRDDGFQMNAGGDSSVDLMFNSNTVHAAGNAGAASAHAGATFDAATTSDVRMSAANDTVDGADGPAVIVNPAGNTNDPLAADSATFAATLDNITVGTAGVAGSGSSGGFGIYVEPTRNTDAQVVVKNSHISGTSQSGLVADHTDGAGHSDITFTGNTIRNVGAGNEPIFVRAGASGGTDRTDMCADIGGAGGDNTNPPGNDFAGQASGGVTDIFFRRPTADANAHLRLPGFTPPASSNLQPYIQGRNVGNPTTVNSSGELEAGPAACQQPTPPVAP